MPESTRLPTDPIVIPAVDAPGENFAADIKAADDCLITELAAARSYDERCAAHRKHRAAYADATAVFYSRWRVAWDAACDATWGPVKPLDET